MSNVLKASFVCDVRMGTLRKGKQLHGLFGVGDGGSASWRVCVFRWGRGGWTLSAHPPWGRGGVEFKRASVNTQIDL